VNASRWLKLADLNLAEANREFARWHPQGEVWEGNDLLLVASPHPFPAGGFNSLIRLAPRAEPPAARALEAARRFFDERKRGFTVWTRAHLDGDLEEACRQADLALLNDSPGMVLEAPLAEAPEPDGITLRPVEDTQAARDFAWVSGRAYQTMGLPLEVSARVFGVPERLLRPHLTSVVAYEDGEALACAMALLSHGIAGVYWVGTVEAGRRRGLGAACTRFVSNAAFRQGASCVVLQASRQGEPVYLRLGYREITRYRWYVAWQPTA
jgi:ribosomal protein S18 acetylase RimI-like enzyme